MDEEQNESDGSSQPVALGFPAGSAVQKALLQNRNVHSKMALIFMGRRGL